MEIYRILKKDSLSFYYGYYGKSLRETFRGEIVELHEFHNFAEESFTSTLTSYP